MEYAKDFENVMKSSDFLGFRKQWIDTYGRTEGGQRHSSKEGVLVVGAGVAGLTTSVRLALHGYKVTIITKEFVPKDTMAPGYCSTVAGALWEYPPSVCGRHRNEMAEARNQGWAVTTYGFLRSVAKLPGDHGVVMRKAMFYTRYHVAERPGEAEKVEAYAKYCDGFERGLHLVDRDLIGPKEVKQIKDCYQVLCPVIDTNRYLLWLHLLALSLGIKMKEGDVPGPLYKYEAKICKEFGVSMIVNCSGLGSKTLVPDPEVYPLRGALVRVWNDGRDFPVVDRAYIISHDQYEVDEQGRANQDIIFLIPRGKVLLLGGIAEEDNWKRDDNLITYQLYRDMLHRCQKFMPILKKATIIEEEPVRVGLRPTHTLGVRNYWENNTRILHNYCHGGSGYSFSIGSAGDVLDKAIQLSKSTPPNAQIPYTSNL